MSLNQPIEQLTESLDEKDDEEKQTGIQDHGGAIYL